MKKIIPTIISVLIFTVSALSQQNGKVAPIKWENYKISDENISIIFPKLPLKMESEDLCARVQTRTYYAYADEIVYQFKVIKKTNKQIPDYCVQIRELGRVDSTDAFREAKSEFEDPQLIKRGEKVFVKSESKTSELKTSKWMYDDEENSRLFLFDIVGRTGKTTNEDQFIDSLKFAGNISGIEINEGSAEIVGDESTKEQTENNPKVENKIEEEIKTLPLMIVNRPIPRYTDKGRKNNVKGQVRLKVTFLQNGSIGNVEVVDGLNDGLTESVITATKRMAFIPSKKGDRNVVVTKTVVYNYSIY